MMERKKIPRQMEIESTSEKQPLNIYTESGSVLVGIVGSCSAHQGRDCCCRTVNLVSLRRSDKNEGVSKSNSRTNTSHTSHKQ